MPLPGQKIRIVVEDGFPETVEVVEDALAEFLKGTPVSLGGGYAAAEEQDQTY